ncbi:MAG TPA: SpoIVB peptidase [Syntrophomonadaceae bacterium]|nr:SpoIVB peptidase [Syntrophomonadaceae bacterium]HRX20147.1 SpoIVB peptidase [Syntrophomonadaceae bacterium]
MRKYRPYFGILLVIVFISLCMTPQAKNVLSLPEYQRMVVGESNNIILSLPDIFAEKIKLELKDPASSVLALPYDPPVAINKEASGFKIIALKPGKAEMQLKLWGYIPLKSIEVESISNQRVVVGGHSIGVLLQSKGIMVVGFAPIISAEGEKIYPARDQGLEIGDLIMKADNKKIESENDLARIIDENGNKKVILEIKRSGKSITIPVPTAYCPETNRHRIGLYVRDGITGVGTLTFWDPNTKYYAALGHIIIDADTKKGINVLKGKIVTASIQTVKAGQPGKPGEKIGVFDDQSSFSGTILKNSNNGIYGRTEGDIVNPKVKYAMEVGYAHQVVTGKAEMFTVVNGNEIEKFEVNIEKIYPGRENGKGMVIRVTDPRLLNLTGGIIQGMSGSPIVQNNRIIGAVTHVFLNDPTRGYGIFMDNMLSEIPGYTNSLNTISTN